jgi:hypothetical protein
MREVYGLVSGRPPARFTGWLMSTDHELPWVDDYEWAEFRQAAQDVRSFELTSAAMSKHIDGLMWRHWVVAYAAAHCLRHSGTDHPVAVECGALDGLTAFFAMREWRARSSAGFEMHLYDAWAGMRLEQLTEQESGQAGRYADTDIDRCRRNLLEFSAEVSFHRGVIPDSLGADAPDRIHYLHIDLNAANPTRDALDFFYPRLQPGGVIVFDDYGWTYYAETKRVVDEFVARASGTLLKMPTGQAIYFHAGP